MKKPFSLALIAALSLALTLPGCQKTDTTAPDQSNQLVVDDLHQGTDTEEEAAALFDDSPGDFFSLRVAADEASTADARLGGDLCGATVTTTKGTGGSFKTTIDFGSTGLTCKDGKVRKGKMTVEFVAGTGREFTRTVVFENYSVDGRVTNGTTTITQVTDKNGTSVKTKAEQLSITTKDGKTIVYSSDKIRTYDRKGTINPEDDEVSITGSSSGTGSDGKGFTSTITKAVVIKNSCGKQNHYPVAGTVEITPAGKPKRVVDYGDGTCDKKFTVTVDGQMVTKEFK